VRHAEPTVNGQRSWPRSGIRSPAEAVPRSAEVERQTVIFNRDPLADSASLIGRVYVYVATGIGTATTLRT
jgi:hypothetical protein